LPNNYQALNQKLDLYNNIYHHMIIILNKRGKALSQRIIMPFSSSIIITPHLSLPKNSQMAPFPHPPNKNNNCLPKYSCKSAIFYINI
jgi:hypothetical protein